MGYHKESILTFDVNKKPTVFFSRKWLQVAVNAFAKEINLQKRSYFSLAFIDAKKIRQLNKRYRRQDQITDVLSFDELTSDFIEKNNTDGQYLGEVVICVSRAKEQAKESKHSLKIEIVQLLIHGLSHLCGYEHENVSLEKVQEMFELEDRIMKRLNFNGSSVSRRIK